eukprot:scaffold3178_cov282-Pinguiococcus_pyrenoidosus.AAC.5
MTSESSGVSYRHSLHQAKSVQVLNSSAKAPAPLNEEESLVTVHTEPRAYGSATQTRSSGTAALWGHSEPSRFGPFPPLLWLFSSDFGAKVAISVTLSLRIHSPIALKPCVHKWGTIQSATEVLRACYVPLGYDLDDVEYFQSLPIEELQIVAEEELYMGETDRDAFLNAMRADFQADIDDHIDAAEDRNETSR